MKVTQLSILGSWIIQFNKIEDNRGFFFESYKETTFRSLFNRTFIFEQINTSISSRGVIRGIHYAQFAPSQAKLVQCLRGKIIDYVIDLRIGSPTFGKYDSYELKEDDAKAIFIEEGLGHSFVSLENKSLVSYCVSKEFNPANEKGISPFDTTLSIEWPSIPLVLSDKDKNGISLLEAKAQNLLPTYKECKEFINSLN